MKKICAIASSFGVPIVAHEHSLLPALHVAASESPETVPCVEYSIRAQETKQFFHDPIYRPQHGFVIVPELPGLGLVLDKSKIDSRETIAF